MKRKIVVMMGVLALSFGLVSLSARADSPVIKTAGGIQYLNGGVGSDERENLRSNFPLKLEFAEKGRPYVNDVRVTITQGGKVVFETLADNGPWLFVNLPAGTYTVKALHNGIERSREVTISSPRARKVIPLRWPTEVGSRLGERDGHVSAGSGSEGAAEDTD